MKIYIITTVEKNDAGTPIGVAFQKKFFFFRDEAFEYAKTLGGECAVMEMIVGETWNLEKIKELTKC